MKKLITWYEQKGKWVYIIKKFMLITYYLFIYYYWGVIACTSCLSVLGSQARTVLFLGVVSFLLRFDPFLGSLWILPHIRKRSAPHVPYKLLGKGMVYHYYTYCPHKLFVHFGEPSLHGFVLRRREFPPQVRPIFGKPLDSTPHQ